MCTAAAVLLRDTSGRPRRARRHRRPSLPRPSCDRSSGANAGPSTAPPLPKAAKLAADQLFEATFDRAPIGMAELDDTGRVIEVNASLCRILEADRATVVGRDLGLIVHERHRADHAARLDSLRSGAVESTRSEHRYRSRSGREVWVDERMSTIDVGDDGRRRIFVHVLGRHRTAPQRMGAHAEGAPRRSHRAPEPRAAAQPVEARAAAPGPQPGQRRRALHRHRPVQVRQRQPRPRDGRRVPRSDRRGASRRPRAPATPSPASAATSSSSCARTSTDRPRR